MTCIVGYIDEKNRKMYMGGDSFGVDSEDHYRSFVSDKVFVKENMLFGFTSSYRMGQLIQYKLVIPEQKEITDSEYIATVFTDSVIKCFKDNKYLANKEGVITGGSFLIAYKGVLYALQDDFSMVIVKNGYGSVGCGRMVALGALEIASKLDIPVEKKIKKAIKAVKKYDSLVGGPVKIVSCEY